MRAFSVKGLVNNMDWDWILKVLERLQKSSLADSIIWIVFLSRFVLLPFFARLNGVSGYIKRYLAIYRRHAAATETLAKNVQSLVKIELLKSRRVRATDKDTLEKL